jgi:hypothetical protein
MSCYTLTTIPLRKHCWCVISIGTNFQELKVSHRRHIYSSWLTERLTHKKFTLYHFKQRTMPLRRIGELGYSSTHSLTSALDGGEWSASRPGRFIPGERDPCTHWIAGWVGPRAVLDTMAQFHTKFHTHSYNVSLLNAITPRGRHVGINDGKL